MLFTEVETELKVPVVEVQRRNSLTVNFKPGGGGSFKAEKKKRPELKRSRSACDEDLYGSDDDESKFLQWSTKV